MERNVSSFVERYQLLYEKDPQSKVFAPLAEAYRRMGLVDEAIDMAEKGVKRHPHFASGRVALGKCFVQKSQYDKALEQLKVAVELSPENLLAHQLLAECFARLRKPAEALNAYKMVLFLNPADAKVAQIVKKLEHDLFMTEEAEIDEDFSMERIEEVKPKKKTRGKDATEADSERDTEKEESLATRDFERELALLDTRFERGGLEFGPGPAPNSFRKISHPPRTGPSQGVHGRADSEQLPYGRTHHSIQNRSDQTQNRETPGAFGTHRKPPKSLISGATSATKVKV